MLVYTIMRGRYTRVLNLNTAVPIPFHSFKRRESFGRLVAGRDYGITCIYHLHFVHDVKDTLVYGDDVTNMVYTI